MTTYAVILIAAVATLLLLPPRLDPAIRIKERRLRNGLRAQRSDDGPLPSRDDRCPEERMTQGMRDHLKPRAATIANSIAIPEYRA